MVFLKGSSVAVLPQTHAIREKAIVITTFNVLKVLSVELITAKEIIPHGVVTGRISLIAV